MTLHTKGYQIIGLVVLLIAVAMMNLQPCFASQSTSSADPAAVPITLANRTPNPAELRFVWAKSSLPHEVGIERSELSRSCACPATKDTLEVCSRRSLNLTSACEALPDNWLRRAERVINLPLGLTAPVAEVKRVFTDLRGLPMKFPGTLRTPYNHGSISVPPVARDVSTRSTSSNGSGS